MSQFLANGRQSAVNPDPWFGQVLLSTQPVEGGGLKLELSERLLTWLCLLFELYVDQFKILNLVRRPFPKKVIGFGFWEELFSNMLYVAVFMNALMLVMTAKITFVGEFICESALGKGKCHRAELMTVGEAGGM